MGKNGCGCRCGGSDEMLSIPRGNDFRVHLCGLDVVPGAKDADFGDIEDLKAYVVSWLGRRDEVEMSTDGADITITVAADIQRCTVYGIELTGTYNGHPWRWKAEKVFRIVESNCEASEQPSETFGVETYYLRDTLMFEIVGDTLHIYSDGHASIRGGTLKLQETRNMGLAVVDDAIVASEK